MHGIIGAEREALNKPAGFKTHSLIGVSSVLIMLCGQYLSTKMGVDASRIPAQLLSGIGFIGAGTILTDGFNVKGLTTAASLLAVTCIGLSIGAGFYLGGVVCTLIIYIILSYSHKMFSKLEHSNIMCFDIVAENRDDIIRNIQILFDKYKVMITKIKSSVDEDTNKKMINISCKCKTGVNTNEIISYISSLENIIEVEEC